MPYSGFSHYSSLSKSYSSFLVWVQNRELAADLLAVSWFTSAPLGQWDVDKARAALVKVQYATGWTDQPETEVDDVLTLHQRLRLFDSKRFAVGDASRVFAGVDGEGDPPLFSSDDNRLSGESGFRLEIGEEG